MDLLVLAAGMGSRFGGLKQIEPVGPNGEFIIDYSVHDAKEFKDQMGEDFDFMVTPLVFDLNKLLVDLSLGIYG